MGSGFESNASETGIQMGEINNFYDTSSHMSSAADELISDAIGGVGGQDTVVNIDDCVDSELAGTVSATQTGAPTFLGNSPTEVQDDLNIAVDKGATTAREQIGQTATGDLIDPNTGEATDDKTKIGNGNENDYGINDPNAQRREQREMAQIATASPQQSADTPINGGTPTANTGGEGFTGPTGTKAADTGAVTANGATGTGPTATGGGNVGGVASAVAAAAAAGGHNVTGGGWASHADMPDASGEFDASAKDSVKVETESTPSAEAGKLDDSAEDRISNEFVATLIQMGLALIQSKHLYDKYLENYEELLDQIEADAIAWYQKKYGKDQSDISKEDIIRAYIHNLGEDEAIDKYGMPYKDVMIIVNIDLTRDSIDEQLASLDEMLVQESGKTLEQIMNGNMIDNIDEYIDYFGANEAYYEYGMSTAEYYIETLEDLQTRITELEQKINDNNNRLAEIADREAALTARKTEIINAARDRTRADMNATNQQLEYEEYYEYTDDETEELARINQELESLNNERESINLENSNNSKKIEYLKVLVDTFSEAFESYKGQYIVDGEISDEALEEYMSQFFDENGISPVRTCKNMTEQQRQEYMDTLYPGQTYRDPSEINPVLFLLYKRHHPDKIYYTDDIDIFAMDPDAQKYADEYTDDELLYLAYLYEKAQNAEDYDSYLQYMHDYNEYQMQLKELGKQRRALKKAIKRIQELEAYVPTEAEIIELLKTQMRESNDPRLQWIVEYSTRNYTRSGLGLMTPDEYEEFYNDNYERSQYMREQEKLYMDERIAYYESIDYTHEEAVEAARADFVISGASAVYDDCLPEDAVTPDEYRKYYESQYNANELELYYKYVLGQLADSLGNDFKVWWKGIQDGVYDFGEGFGKLFMTLLTHEGEMSEQDYVVMFYIQYLSTHSEALDKWYRNGQSVGVMTPVVLTSMLINMIAPGAGGDFALAMMAISSAGTTLNEELLAGHEFELALLYAALSSGKEVLLEKYLGGIFGIAEDEMPFLISLISEGREEAIETILDYYLRHVIYGEPINLKQMAFDTWDSFVQGMLIAGELNGFTGLLRFSVAGVSYTINMTPELLEAYKVGGLAAVKAMLFDVDTSGNVTPKADAYIYDGDSLAAVVDVENLPPESIQRILDHISENIDPSQEGKNLSEMPVELVTQAIEELAYNDNVSVEAEIIALENSDISLEDAQRAIELKNKWNITEKKALDMIREMNLDPSLTEKEAYLITDLVEEGYDVDVAREIAKKSTMLEELSSDIETETDVTKAREKVTNFLKTLNTTELLYFLDHMPNNHKLAQLISNILSYDFLHNGYPGNFPNLDIVAVAEELVKKYPGMQEFIDAYKSTSQYGWIIDKTTGKPIPGKLETWLVLHFLQAQYLGNNPDVNLLDLANETYKSQGKHFDTAEDAYFAILADCMDCRRHINELQTKLDNLSKTETARAAEIQAEIDAYYNEHQWLVDLTREIASRNGHDPSGIDVVSSMQYNNALYKWENLGRKGVESSNMNGGMCCCEVSEVDAWLMSTIERLIESGMSPSEIQRALIDEYVDYAALNPGDWKQGLIQRAVAYGADGLLYLTDGLNINAFDLEWALGGETLGLNEEFVLHNATFISDESLSGNVKKVKARVEYKDGSPVLDSEGNEIFVEVNYSYGVEGMIEELYNSGRITDDADLSKLAEYYKIITGNDIPTW